MPDQVIVTIPPEAPSASAPETKPQLILGKFKSQEDLAAAYAELEKKLGSGKAAAEPNPATPPAEKKPVEQSGQPQFDISAYETEYDSGGKLSDESYAALAAKHNLPREVVDQFIQSRLATRTAAENEVFEVVGGKEQYGTLMQWAGSSLSPQEVVAYDKAVSSKDADIIKLAVQGLHARYTAANGRDPKLIGGSGPASGPAAFQSWAQVKEAMKDPRYTKDPAYQKDVERRMAVSKL